MCEGGLGATWTATLAHSGERLPRIRRHAVGRPSADCAMARSLRCGGGGSLVPRAGSAAAWWPPTPSRPPVWWVQAAQLERFGNSVTGVLRHGPAGATVRASESDRDGIA